MRSKIGLALFLLFWFGCGYVNTAIISGSLCEQFCGPEHFNVETPRSAIRFGVLYFIVGPLGFGADLVSYLDAETIYWDWPVRYYQALPK